jgi:hypothetical protein
MVPRAACPPGGSSWYKSNGHLQTRNQNHRCKRWGRAVVRNPENQGITEAHRPLIARPLLARPVHGCWHPSCGRLLVRSSGSSTLAHSSVCRETAHPWHAFRVQDGRVPEHSSETLAKS